MKNTAKLFVTFDNSESFYEQHILELALKHEIVPVSTITKRPTYIFKASTKSLVEFLDAVAISEDLKTADEQRILELALQYEFVPVLTIHERPSYLFEAPLKSLIKFLDELDNIYDFEFVINNPTT